VGGVAFVTSVPSVKRWVPGPDGGGADGVVHVDQGHRDVDRISRQGGADTIVREQVPRVTMHVLPVGAGIGGHGADAREPHVLAD
jgi:hypothetical protein